MTNENTSKTISQKEAENIARKAIGDLYGEEYNSRILDIEGAELKWNDGRIADKVINGGEKTLIWDIDLLYRESPDTTVFSAGGFVCIDAHTGEVLFVSGI